MSAAPSLASATEPVFDSSFDTRLINIIGVRSSVSSDYAALEALDDTRTPLSKAILAELAYGRVVAQAAPPLYYAQQAGLSYPVGTQSTASWLQATWGSSVIWQQLEWPDNVGFDASASFNFSFDRRKPGDYLCGSIPGGPTVSTFGFALKWHTSPSSGTCVVSHKRPVPLPWYWDEELIPSYQQNPGRSIYTPFGCPELVDSVNVDEGCYTRWASELTMRKLLWHKNAQPWVSQSFSGYPTETYNWHPGVSTPPSDADMRADFREALLDPGMSELRGYLNHLFDPSGYQMPVPSEQTLGLCKNNLERSTCHQIMAADPVNTATGALVEQVADLSLPGLGVPFTLTRTYNSNAPLETTGVDSPLGPRWRMSFQTSVQVDDEDNVTVIATDGQQAFFEKDGSDYIAPAGIRSTLTLSSGTFHLRTSDGSQTLYDEATGRATAMVDRFGHGLDLAYDGSGNLETVTDEAGREVTFTYDDVDAGTTTRTRLVSVELPDEREVTYAYSDSDTAPLVQVTDTLGGETHYSYDNPDSEALLTEIEDANENVVAATSYDDQGRVSGQEDAEGGITNFDYDDSSGEVVITLPDESTETERYSGNVIVAQTDGEGNTTSYGYDDALNRTRITDGRGVVTEMEYDGAGNLIETSVPSMSLTETRTYDADNNLLTITDARGKTTTYTWDDGLLVEAEAPDGGTITYDHNGDDQVSSVTDARGKTSTFEYDADFNLEQTTSPGGAESSFTYDESGRRLTATDADGGVTNYVYDDADRLVSITDPLERETTHTYDAVGNRLTTTDPAEGVTTIAYDDLYRPVSVTDPEEHTTTTAYDEVGNVVSITTPTGAETTFGYDAARNRISMVSARGNAEGADPEDFTWRYGYDEVGNQTSVEDPLEGETTTVFDDLSRPTSVEDPLGHVTEMAYNATGGLTSLTDAEENTTTTSFDDVGRPLVVTSPEGRTTTKAYDLAGNLVSLTDGVGKTATFTYDDDGHLASLVDPRGNEGGADPDDFRTTYTYDDAGQLLEVEDPLEHTVTRTYDDVGNLLSVTDANSHTTSYAYDDLDRVTEVTAPGAAVTGFTYDAAGNQLTRTDARSKTTSFSYDDDGRLLETELPTGEILSVAYDAEGNPITEVTGRGNASVTPANGTITRAFDPLGRLTEIDYGDATPDVQFSYDAAGRLTQMDDGPGTETYAYDDAGRLTSITRGSDVLGYAYDDDGLITTRTQPGSVSVAATYDNAGRMASVTAAGVTTGFAYDAAGNLVETTLPSGTGYTSDRSYDEAGRLVAVENAAGGILSRFEQTLDPVGNPTRIDTTRGLTTTSEAFAYDNRDRLTTWCPGQTDCTSPSASVAYSYDAVGNRTQGVRTNVANPGTTTYAYDDSNRLTSSTIGLDTTNYAYDEDGNQTQAGTTDIAYDLAGRMTSIDDGTATTFIYDGQGKRLRATTGASQVRYLWDPQAANAELVLERDASNDLIRRHTSGVGGDPLAVSDGSSTYYYLADLMGSTSDLISSTGVAQSRYSYEPFGQSSETKLVGGAPDNPVRFTGEYEDPSGQLYLRARQYDPSLGRFGAEDPIDDNQATSQYAYVSNRPRVLADPSGEIGVPGWARSFGDRLISNPYLQYNIGGAAPTWNVGVATVQTAHRSVTDPIGLAKDAIQPCAGAYSLQGGGSYGVLACAHNLNPVVDLQRTAVKSARLLVNGCSNELGQVIGPVAASFAVGGGAGVLARTGARALGPAASKAATAARARAATPRSLEGQRGSFTPGAWFAGASGRGGFVTLYHGSVRDATAIRSRGLDPSRGTTWASRDRAAAEDAISSRRLETGGDRGVIESRIPIEEWERMERALGEGGDYVERPYPGFHGSNLNSSEVVMRSQRMIELFNRYMVR